VRFASLGSGSKGNATLVGHGDTLVMIDCGFSAREASRRMERLDVDPQALDAILVTHEHSDHSAGVAAFSRKFQTPVYMTHGTASTGRVKNCFDFRCIAPGDSFSVGALEVEAIAVPHDAREPCQYRLSGPRGSLGVLTDLGSITPHIVESYADCDALLLEFNHDAEMLFDGDYPLSLKHRVGGDWGHLNNEQAVELLEQIDVPRLQHLVVAHVSQNNNCLDKAAAALEGVDGLDQSRVVWAGQGEGFGWLSL